MTKEEFYKSAIELHKKCGQGISGIVKLGTEPRIARYLDELIEEGLMKACDTGGSIGHPESNIFYMPTKGYNVWEDEGTDGQYSGFCILKSLKLFIFRCSLLIYFQTKICLIYI